MAHELINPPELLAPQGFTHVVAAAPGRTVHIAGQTAHDADGQVQGETMAAQAAAALANLATALAAAGATPEHLVTMQVYVTDADAYREALGEIGQAWRTHLGRHYPAVSLFGVTRLFDSAARIELVATAVIPD